MNLTIETLLSDPRIVTAIIDRTFQAEKDKINWPRYLKAHDAKGETFATYFGTVASVAAGSMTDRYGRKKLRARRNIGSGVGTVGSFGDAFQMDNKTLDDVLLLINKYNETKNNKFITEIVDFLIDDFRDVVMAPMIAIDKLIGEARSRGVYHIDINGKDGEDIALPVRKVIASSEDLGSCVSWFRKLLKSHKDQFGNAYSLMQMTRNTFDEKIASSSEFVNAFSLKFGNIGINPMNIITPELATTYFKGAGIKLDIEIVDESMTLANGSQYEAFADNAICLLPNTGLLGTLEYYKSNNWFDPVPGKKYTEAHNGAVLISSSRTDEGRFLEYEMNAAPNLSAPQKIAVLDVSAAMPTK